MDICPLKSYLHFKIYFERGVLGFVSAMNKKVRDFIVAIDDTTPFIRAYRSWYGGKQKAIKDELMPIAEVRLDTDEIFATRHVGYGDAISLQPRRHFKVFRVESHSL